MTGSDQLGLFRVEQPPPQRVGGAPSDLWAEYIRARTAYVACRHAPEELVAALFWAAAEGQARRVDTCGHVWAEYRGQDGYQWHLLRCRSRWCPYCGSVWQREVIARLSAAGVPEGCTTTVATVTTGRRIRADALGQTIKRTVQVWKRWRTWAQGQGVRGGIYSIEVVPPAVDEQEGWHVHLHAVLVVDRAAGWMEADRRWVVERRPDRGQTTPALVWFTRSWALILRRWWRDRYDELPLATELLPSVRRDWPGITVECPKRLAVCDLGGRWPQARDHRPVASLDAGDPGPDLRQALKYVAKPLAGDARPTRSMWIELVNAMAGRRRAQTWGCWYGLRLSTPEETEDVDDPEAAAESIERTGRILFWTARRDVHISDTIGSYWYGWSMVGRPEWHTGYCLATVAARQDNEDGG